MGNRRPKSEQLDKRLLRKVGMTLTEMLVTLAIASIVLLTVSVITTSTFRITGQVSTILELDDQSTRLNTNMRYLVTRKWTALPPEEFSPSSITLISEFPGLTQQITTTLSLVGDSLILEFPINEDMSVGQIKIAEYIRELTFELRDKYLYYSVTFEKNGIEREVEGAVRFN